MIGNERWAKRGHELYEQLAPKYTFVSSKESALAWEKIPETNRALMIEIYGQLVQEARQEVLEEAATKAEEVAEYHRLIGGSMGRLIATSIAWEIRELKDIYQSI